MRDLGTPDRRDRVTRGALLRVVRVAAQSVEDADDLLRSSVANAREAGATWDEIGDAVGINSEAAAKRYRS